MFEDKSHQVLPRHVSIVVDERSGKTVRGLFNQLTGECYSFSDAALAELLETQDGGCLASTRTALSERGFFDATPSLAIGRMLDHWLTMPARNPAIVFWTGTQATVFRPDTLEMCLLPRPDSMPPILREDLSEDASRLCACAANEELLGEVFNRMEWGRGRLYDALCELARPDRQLIRLARSHEQLTDLDAQMHFPMQSFKNSGPVADAIEHYGNPSLSAEKNFSWSEPTVAYSFRKPTEALRGLDYGAAFLNAFLARIRNGESRLRVLEVGGGSGTLAAGFLQAADAAGLRVEYHLQDLSSAFLEAQRALLAHRWHDVHYHLADAQNSIPELEFDGIVLNEVIADLDVHRAEFGVVRQSGTERIIELIKPRLRQTGVAVLTEYGSLCQPPQPVAHLQHLEHSIDFDALRSFSASLGLEIELMPLADILNFNLDTRMLVGQQERHLCLQAAFDVLGSPGLESRAYTEHEFRKQFGDVAKQARVSRISFVPMYHGMYFGPDVRQFTALCLKHSDFSNE